VRNFDRYIGKPSPGELSRRGSTDLSARRVIMTETASPATATRFARVLRADELRDGELIPVEIDGTPVVLVRHQGEFYAVQNNCSHRDFPLSEAGFDPRDGVLVCAWHGGCFDVRTGDAVVPPATDPVEIFPVRVVDGWVELGLTGSLVRERGAA
jgi:3-phenylpropionate/trans-cinnamate dioxygenase ferredoxin subunit